MEPVASKAEKLALLDSALTRTVESLGDITAPVMASFYARFPQALDAFERLALGDRPGLEGQMVENSVYCVMHWLQSQSEIEIILWNSVPHHARTLEIPGNIYGGMIDATLDVIEETVPSEAAGERAVLTEIRSGLGQTMASIETDVARMVA